MQNQTIFKETQVTSEKISYNAVYPQASIAAAVTKSDATILTACALFVGVGGDLTVTMASSGDDIVFKNVPNGTFMPILVTKVKAATTATDILALR